MYGKTSDVRFDKKKNIGKKLIQEVAISPSFLFGFVRDYIKALVLAKFLGTSHVRSAVIIQHYPEHTKVSVTDDILPQTLPHYTRLHAIKLWLMVKTLKRLRGVPRTACCHLGVTFVRGVQAISHLTVRQVTAIAPLTDAFCFR